MNGPNLGCPTGEPGIAIETTTLVPHTGTMPVTLLLYLLGILPALIGLLGALLPILPGVPILYAGLLITARADNFHRVGLPTLLVLALLTVIAWSIDLIAGALGAKRYGACYSSSPCVS